MRAGVIAACLVAACAGNSSSNTTADETTAGPAAAQPAPPATAQKAADAMTEQPGTDNQKTAPTPAPKSDDYRAAVALLRSPDTWCNGAGKLAKLGDSDALVPLVRAYESRAESEKMCLLDAMEALGPVPVAHALAGNSSADDRRIGAHLMELFADASHIAPLSALVNDADERVRRQALRAIATQKQTPAWETAMIGLLSSAHREVRLQAIESLSRRRTDSARDALRAQAARETDPALKAKLDQLK